MVALPYWYLYLVGDDVEVDFNVGPIDTAVNEASGPMAPRSRRVHVLHGREISPEHPIAQLPHSGTGMTSAVSRELSGEKYGKRLNSGNDEEKDSGHQSDRTAV